MRSTAVAVVLALFVVSTFAAQIQFDPSPSSVVIPLGKSQTFTVNVNVNFPNVSAAIIENPDYYEVTPKALNFSSGATTLEVTFTAKAQAGTVLVYLIIDGDDGYQYNPVSFYLQFNSRQPIFTNGYASYPLAASPVVGVATSSFKLSLDTYPTAPATVTVHVESDPAGAVTFSQQTFTFTSTVEGFPFSFTPNTVVDGGVVIYFTYSGADAAYYQNRNDTIYVQKRTLKPYPVSPAAPKVFEPSALLTYSVDYLPKDSLTLSLWADGITFTPSEFTFTSSVGSFTYSYKASTTGLHTVVYTLSGPDAPLYAAIANGTINIGGHAFDVVTPTQQSYQVGQTSQPFTISTQHVPQTDVSLALTVTYNCPPGEAVTLSTSVLNYNKDVLSQVFTLTTNAVCSNVQVTAETAGTEADLYGAPIINFVISFDKIDVDVFSADPNFYLPGSTLYCGDTLPLTLVLSGPPPNGFTVTVSAAGGALSQSVFVFTPTATTFGFSLTPSYVQGSVLLKFAVTGVDSALVSTIPDLTVYSGAKTLTPPAGTAFSSGNLLVGSLSNQVNVAVNHLAATGVSLNVQATGLTFTPNPVVFGPNDATRPLQVLGGASGTYTVTYSLSGADASCYSLFRTTTTITVGKLSLTIAPTTIQEVVVGVESMTYTVSIANLAPGTDVVVTPVAQDQFGNVLSGIYTFTPASITLTDLAPKATFTYVVSAVRPANDQIILTTDDVDVSELTLNTAGVNLRSFNMPTLVAATTSVRPAYAVYDVPSAPYLVTIDEDQRPATEVILRPVAPNTVFTPAELKFGPNTPFLAFTFTTSQGANVPGNVGLTTTITWFVEGTDAALYQVPGTNSFYANLRSLVVASAATLLSRGVVYNTPIPFTITTPFAPASDLTIVPYGSSFTFSSPVTLAAGSTSVTFTATPTVVEDDQVIRFSLSGTEAAKYVTLADITNIDVVKSAFTVSYPSITPTTLTYGGQPYVFHIVINSPPTTSVTLNFFSSQVVAEPALVTFTPTTLAFDVSISPLYTPFAAPGTSTNVDLEYVLTGPDADNYGVPSDFFGTFSLTQPLRQLTVNPTGLAILPGRSGTVVVSSAILPLNGVTITPTVASSTDYVFSPASAELTATSSAVVFTVSRKSSTPAPQATVIFSVTGRDAFLYANGNAVLTLTPQSASATVTGLADSQTYTVGRKYTATVTLSNPPIGGDYVVTPYVITGQQYVFNPLPLTFASGVVSQTFTFTATGRGSSRIGFKTSGTAATQFAFIEDRDVLSSAAGINFDYPNSLDVAGSVSDEYSVTLNVPVTTGLTIALDAPGFTFTPATLTFGPGDITQTYTATATVNNANSRLITILGGADAVRYENPCDYADGCFISSGLGEVSVSLSASAVGKITITFYLSSASTQEVTITPSTTLAASKKRAILAEGVTFTPASVTFAPGVTQLSVVAFAQTPGLYNLYYTISGAGAASFFTVADQVANPVGLNFLKPSAAVTTTPPAVPVGAVSQPFIITLTGPAPGVTVPTLILTPWASVPGVVFYPPTIWINNSAPVSFAYSASTAGSFSINFALSGPGADVFDPVPAVGVTVGFSSFTAPTFTNLYMNPNPAQAFVYGISSQYFTVHARSVPTNVTLTPVSDAVTFEPATLFFTSTSHSASFKFTPKKVGPFQISYIVGGNDASQFAIPATSAVLRATYKINIPVIPTLTVGNPSDPVSFSIEPAPASTFKLDLAATGLVFSPASLVFTPGQTSHSTIITPTAVNLPKPTVGGAHIPGVSGSIGGGSSTQISFTGTDAAETTAITIPTTNPVGVIVGPGYFSIEHPRYQLDVESTIKISISTPPRADVTLSLFSNNLHISPPYVTFNRDGTTTKELTVTPRQTTSYELDYASFKVDYALSGSNSADFITPSESLHYFAIPRGYIAAIVLVPIAVVVIALVVIIVLRKVASSS